MHLFVYGTLRRAAAHSMHPLLSPATFVGRACFQGRLYDLGAYPAAVASEDRPDLVHGEVYRLHDPDTTLDRLDRYEGCSPDDPSPHEYQRTSVHVRLDRAAGLVAVQMYLYACPTKNLTRITPGDYLYWRQRFPPAAPPSGA